MRAIFDIFIITLPANLILGLIIYYFIDLDNRRLNRKWLKNKFNAYNGKSLSL
jgi:hypothetical protein